MKLLLLFVVVVVVRMVLLLSQPLPSPAAPPPPPLRLPFRNLPFFGTLLRTRPLSFPLPSAPELTTGRIKGGGDWPSIRFLSSAPPFSGSLSDPEAEEELDAPIVASCTDLRWLRCARLIFRRSHFCSSTSDRLLIGLSLASPFASARNFSISSGCTRSDVSRRFSGLSGGRRPALTPATIPLTVTAVTVGLEGLLLSKRGCVSYGSLSCFTWGCDSCVGSFLMMGDRMTMRDVRLGVVESGG